MKAYLIINDIGYTILDPLNTTVKNMDFSDNRKIEFLPTSPCKNFPNLKRYKAARCAIKEIQKRNFEKLQHLLEVYLQENQIYAVLSGTFEHLKNLEVLNLSKFARPC